MRLGLVLLCAFSTAGCGAHAAEQCGDLSNGYGPYDYRRDKARLPIVEVNHFDANVENLIRGKNAMLGGDIDYTLRAFPNHHRALLAMERLAARVKNDRPHQANYTITCYYERAVRFRPDDGVVRMLYANFLAKRGNPEAAIKHMEAAEKSLQPNANLYYNMGLVYTDLKQYDRALENAHKAYQLGFTLPGLKNKLQQAGKWREPSVGAAGTVEAPASQAVKAVPKAAAESKAEATAAADEPAQKP
jgi:tetratricopeptide (TPR) repeat protein